MSRIIAVANAKGGVGKTTTTANLASALAERGYKVLAVDLDPQASLSVSLGISVTDGLASIGEVLTSRSSLPSATIHTSENFDLVPAHHRLRNVEQELQNSRVRVYSLQNILAPVRSQYAYILLDCPANAGILTGNALAAADQVVIPFPADYLSLQALMWFLTIIKEARDRVNPRLQVAGLFLIMYDPRVKHTHEMIVEAQEKYGIEAPFFASSVRQAVAVRQAARFGQSVLKYAPSSAVAESFRGLAREIIEGKHEWEDASPAFRQALEAQLQQDRARAYVAFCEVTRVAPGLVEGWIGRAQNAADWGDAALSFAKALTLDPDSTDAREGLNASVHDRLADCGAVHISALLQVARCLSSHGQYSYAEPIYRRLTELDPNCAEAWVGLGRASLNVQEAIHYSERAVQLAPDNPEARQGLKSVQARLKDQAQDKIDEAQSLALKGERGRAHVLYRQAVQMDSDNVNGWLGCARTAPRSRQSLEFAQRALVVDPSNAQARELCDRLFASQGRASWLRRLLPLKTSSSPM